MSSYQTMKTPGDLSWFTHDRFGMFIHFGLYAMPARHEWIKSYEEISDALDLDLGTVKSRIARAREKLRNYLLRSGNFSGYAPSNKAEKEG